MDTSKLVNRPCDKSLAASAAHPDLQLHCLYAHKVVDRVKFKLKKKKRKMKKILKVDSWEPAKKVGETWPWPC